MKKLGLKLTMTDGSKKDYVILNFPEERCVNVSSFLCEAFTRELVGAVQALAKKFLIEDPCV